MALDLLIDKAGLGGETDIDIACGKIAAYLHNKHGLKYDHMWGAARYVKNIENRVDSTGAVIKDPVSGSPVSQDRFDIELSTYLYATPPEVNCYDQAAALMSLTNLIGGWTWYQYMCRYGLVNEVAHVGGVYANNPFHNGWAIASLGPPLVLGLPFDRRPVVGVDDLPVDGDRDGDLDRSMFGNHAFIMAAPGYDTVWDACIGPKARVDLATYLRDGIDSSTPAEARVAGTRAKIQGTRGVPMLYLK
jgi:hypothetical protein